LDENRKKEIIKASVAIASIILVIIVVVLINFKYNIEGEKNMPFKLSKITIVSTAEGIENEQTEEKWNFSIFQNNDVYFSIEKNENNKEDEIIQSISIENIQIVDEPKVGKIITYMPNSSEGRTFAMKDEYIVQEGKLTFKGASKSNSKTLEIGNQGGTAVVRFANTNLGNYASNEDEQIVHDGSLIAKTEAKDEDLKFTVSFDFVINLREKSYVSKILLTMPCTENLTQEGTSSKEIKDNFIFKRVVNNR